MCCVLKFGGVKAEKMTRSLNLPSIPFLGAPAKFCHVHRFASSRRQNDSVTSVERQPSSLPPTSTQPHLETADGLKATQRSPTINIGLDAYKIPPIAPWQLLRETSRMLLLHTPLICRPGRGAEIRYKVWGPSCRQSHPAIQHAKLEGACRELPQ